MRRASTSYRTAARRMEGNGRRPTTGSTSESTSNRVITGVITKETALARLLSSELQLDAPVAVDVRSREDRLQQRLRPPRLQ